MYISLKRTISALLALVIALSAVFMLCACNAPDSDINNGGEDNGDLPSGDGAQNGDDGNTNAGTIICPEYKEYDRNTVSFKDISYKRPDFERVIGAVESVTENITKNEMTFEGQIAIIEALEPDYNDVLTMYAFANIYNSKDSGITYWNDEYTYIVTNYPSFVSALEDMFVAAANSPHAERFETDYFGEGLIEEYRDGGNYTDEMIALWSEEEGLEADYSSISTATVKVTYDGKEDTVDNILNYYAEKYGTNSQKYNLAYTSCMDKYEQRATIVAADILVDLFRVRRKIADELGYDSYIEHAYDSLGRDYDHEQMNDLLDDIAEYVLPVYATLNHYIFSNYFMLNTASELEISDLINNGYYMMTELDGELGDIYSYMLQFGLYDISGAKTNRLDGAFTTYLDKYDAPYTFITAYESTTDYSTLFHEFGHFAEFFINYRSGASLDANEVSSQGLEYIMLNHLGDFVSNKDKKYLKYTALEGALTTLIFQGFYARFEDIAYRIPESDISKETLDRAVATAARDFSLNDEVLCDVSYVNIPHIYISPMYVQSYCTSVIPALDLYFKESKQSGSGVELYKSYLHLMGEDVSFTEALERIGLASPFDNGVTMEIADAIYYEIVGTHFYGQENGDDASNAA